MAGAVRKWSNQPIESLAFGRIRGQKSILLAKDKDQSPPPARTDYPTVLAATTKGGDMSSTLGLGQSLN